MDFKIYLKKIKSANRIVVQTQYCNGFLVISKLDMALLQLFQNTNFDCANWNKFNHSVVCNHPVIIRSYLTYMVTSSTRTIQFNGSITFHIQREEFKKRAFKYEKIQTHVQLCRLEMAPLLNKYY